MKQFITLLFLLVIGLCQSSAQENHQYFALIYTTGENWDSNKSYSEQVYFTEHTEFLSTLRKEGSIALGARYSDKGLIVLKVRNEDEAKELLSKDLSVKHKTFNAELLYFSPIYYGCLEKE